LYRRCIGISDCPASDELHVALAQRSALHVFDVVPQDNRREPGLDLVGHVLVN
jgi:hypothetical protein